MMSNEACIATVAQEPSVLNFQERQWLQWNVSGRSYSLYVRIREAWSSHNDIETLHCQL